MKWSWILAIVTLPGCVWIFPLAAEVDDLETYVHVRSKDGGCELIKRTYTADRQKQVGVDKEGTSGLLHIESQEN